MIRSNTLNFAVACAVIFGLHSPAAQASVETVIDFSTDGAGVPYSHGDIVQPDDFEEFFVELLLGDNFRISGGPDQLRIFDTSLPAGTTEDPDLLGPPFSKGNLVKNDGSGDLIDGVSIGNILIIQEDPNSPEPDDEGRRPAGTITFEFDRPIFYFGFDLIDVEVAESSLGHFVSFFQGNTIIEKVLFSDFTDPGSNYYMPGVEFGDNTANRIAPITRDMLGTDEGFDQVVIQLGGSGGIDNVRFVVPEATSIVVWTLLAGMGAFAIVRSRLAING